MTAGVKKLRDINFCGNLIRTGGDTFISDCIRNNDSRLDTLKLGDNFIDNNDAMNIAMAF